MMKEWFGLMIQEKTEEKQVEKAFENTVNGSSSYSNNEEREEDPEYMPDYIPGTLDDFPAECVCGGSILPMYEDHPHFGSYCTRCDV